MVLNRRFFVPSVKTQEALKVRAELILLDAFPRRVACMQGTGWGPKQRLGPPFGAKDRQLRRLEPLGSAGRPKQRGLSQPLIRQPAPLGAASFQHQETRLSLSWQVVYRPMSG